MGTIQGVPASPRLVSVRRGVRHTRDVFHGQNVYPGQRSPIMRILLLLLSCVCFFSAR
jgi:hypothetical protein